MRASYNICEPAVANVASVPSIAVLGHQAGKQVTNDRSVSRHVTNSGPMTGRDCDYGEDHSRYAWSSVRPCGQQRLGGGHQHS